MSKTSKAFENGKAFIPFVTAGDPDLETTRRLIIAMAESGADLIEIGIPFSDPIAEGLDIQQADERALAAGTTTDKIFDMVAQVRETLPELPLAFMTYINPIYVYGCEKFLTKCEQLKIDAIIVPDIPYEEKNELLPYCQKHGVDLISLMVPSSDNRIKMIAAESQGFIYCVLSNSTDNEFATDTSELIKSVREVSQTPVAISLAVSTPEQAKAMAQYADGVIVSNAVVKLCKQYGNDCVEPVKEYVKSMKQALLSSQKQRTNRNDK